MWGTGDVVMICTANGFDAIQTRLPLSVMIAIKY